MSYLHEKSPLADSDVDDMLAALHFAEKTGSLEQVDVIKRAIEYELLSHGWKDWLTQIFPQHCSHDFAPHHEKFWNWVWNIQDDKASKPFIAIWPRGGAKSTSAELACAALGARGARSYALYVSGTQDRADDHVGNVAASLESDALGRHYPALSSRRVGKYGSSRGWRRNRVRTAAGFTVDAIGLDTAARGIKLEDRRPDLIILDDLDDALDSVGTTEKKINALTRTILPAMAETGTVLAIQNIVHADSIFSRLADGRAEFLIHREVSGPIPAIEDLLTGPRKSGGYEIVSGNATWSGQSLTSCQRMIDEFGLTAFLIECQHDTNIRSGGLFDHIDFQHMAREDMPDMVEITVWVDPAVTDTDRSDSQGIQVDGIGSDHKIYRLRSWEQRSSPVLTLRQAIVWAYEEGAEVVGVETDQGGDTWSSVFREAKLMVLNERPDFANKRDPKFRWAKAGAGHGPKAHRAAQMLTDYEQGRIIHSFDCAPILERALRRFPIVKPYDLVDAAYWSWIYLRRKSPIRTSGSSVAYARI